MGITKTLFIIFLPILLLGQVDTVSFEQIKIIPGSTVPDFSALDETEEIRQLSELKGKKNLIMIFFRGYWWPHCRRQLAELSKIKLPKDTKLWTVSVEGLSANAKFKKQNTKKGHPITFPLLWDMDGEIINSFGLKDPRYKGGKYEGIPYASTYIIDKNGKVIFAHIALTYSKRPSIDQILSEL